MNLDMYMEEHNSYKNSHFYKKLIMSLHGNICHKGEKKICITESLNFSVLTNLFPMWSSAKISNNLYGWRSASCREQLLGL